MGRSKDPKDAKCARHAIEKLGWLPVKVSYKVTVPGNPWPLNRDLWGWGDLLLLEHVFVPRVFSNDHLFQVYLVNACGQQGVSAHIKTLMEKAQEGLDWLNTHEHRCGRACSCGECESPPSNHPAHLWQFVQEGGLIEVWQWRKLKRRLTPERRRVTKRTHTKARYWTLRRVRLSLHRDVRGRADMAQRDIDALEGRVR